MAWNRPSNDGRAGSPCPPHIGQPKAALRSKVARAVRGGTPRPTVRGAIAGALVVLGAAVAAWWLWPNASAPVAEDGDGTEKGLIKAVEPAVPKAVEVPEKPMTEAERIFAETNGMSAGRLRQWEFKNWKGRVLTNGAHRVKSLPEQVFANDADRLIAGLLLVEPGNMIIGDS